MIKRDWCRLLECPGRVDISVWFVWLFLMGLCWYDVGKVAIVFVVLECETETEGVCAVACLLDDVERVWW